MIKTINGEQWYCCPHCGQKIFKVDSSARCDGVKIKCKGRNCGKEINVNFKELSL